MAADKKKETGKRISYNWVHLKESLSLLVSWPYAGPMLVLCWPYAGPLTSVLGLYLLIWPHFKALLKPFFYMLTGWRKCILSKATLPLYWPLFSCGLLVLPSDWPSLCWSWVMFTLVLCILVGSLIVLCWSVLTMRGAPDQECRS